METPQQNPPQEGAEQGATAQEASPQVHACELPEGYILLGSYVKDTTNGLKGKVIARSIHLNRCVQLHIQPIELNDNGEMYNESATDIQNVELLGEGELPAGKRQPEEEILESIDEDLYLGAVVQHKDTNFKGTAVIAIERLRKEPILVVDGQWTKGKVPREVMSVSDVEIVTPPKPRPATSAAAQVTAARAESRLQEARTGCMSMDGVSVRS